MAKGYWISRYTSTDPDATSAYSEAARAVVQQFGGKPVIGNGQYETVEGMETKNNVVVEFESFEQAKACYHSAEYQTALDTVRDLYPRHLIIIEGFDGS